MKSILKKLSFTTFLVACFFMMIGFRADAATKEYKRIEFNSITDKSVNTRIKVGKYYFHFEKSPNFVRYSKKSKDAGKRIKKSPTQIFTNGTYAYYLDDNNVIYRLTLSSNKLKKIKKPAIGTCDLIVSVYGDDIFYMNCTINDEGTLRAYNVKTKKTRTLRKKVSVEGISRSLKYIAYSVGKTGYLYNCKTKKTVKFATDVQYNQIKYVYDGALYYINTANNIVKYNISSKKKTTVSKLPVNAGIVVAYKNGKLYYDGDEDVRIDGSLYCVSYRYCISVKTGKVISKTEYDRYGLPEDEDEY